MIKEIVACPDGCHGRAIRLGCIVGTNVFAGRRLDRLVGKGELYRCEQCRLCFRWPQMSLEELNMLYSLGHEEAWTSTPEERKDWSIAYNWIRNYVPRRKSVLDVGCFDGGFLDGLGDDYLRYGVEINPKACKLAQRRGVHIVGDDFHSFSGAYDCICAFDVIEHVSCPRSFVLEMKKRLNDKGILIISSGNADHWTFRLAKGRYWYCAIAEHLSFIGKEWLDALDVGLSLLKVSDFSHSTTSLGVRLKELLFNAAYLLTPTVVAKARMHGVGGIDTVRFPEMAEFPPMWMSAKDHFIFVMRKR